MPQHEGANGLTHHRQVQQRMTHFTRPNVPDLLESIAKTLPERRIHTDGDLYMRRFYLSGPMPQELAERWPESDRPPVVPGRGITTYLHCIHRPDMVRHLHNHPWSARVRILWGAYSEVRFLSRMRAGTSTLLREAGDVYELEHSDYHHISQLATSRVWTLFSHTPKKQGWGFWVDGKHIPHREYEGWPWTGG